MSFPCASILFGEGGGMGASFFTNKTRWALRMQITKKSDTDRSIFSDDTNVVMFMRDEILVQPL